MPDNDNDINVNSSDAQSQPQPAPASAIPTSGRTPEQVWEELEERKAQRGAKQPWPVITPEQSLRLAIVAASDAALPPEWKEVVVRLLSNTASLRLDLSAAQLELVEEREVMGARVERFQAAMADIGEYWNGHETAEAMADVLRHIQGVVELALNPPVLPSLLSAEMRPKDA